MPVLPANIIKRVTPRDCKVVKKQDCLPELFSLKLVDANYKGDNQIEAISDKLVLKDPNFAEEVWARGGFPDQYADYFHMRDGCLWMQERLAIPILLRRPIIIRTHSYHPAKPVWLTQRGKFSSLYSSEPGVGRRRVCNVQSDRWKLKNSMLKKWSKHRVRGKRTKFMYSARILVAYQLFKRIGQVRVGGGRSVLSIAICNDMQ